MIYLIAAFLVLEVMVAGRFYLLGRIQVVEELEDAGALCDKWYEIKKSEEEDP